MGPTGEQQNADEPGRTSRAGSAGQTQVAAPAPGLSSPDRLLALQRAAGNRAVARLITGSTQREARPGSRPERAMAYAVTPTDRPLQRSFFGKIWGGIKSAASAVWSGVKGAASWVWEGAKRLGSEVVEWLKTAGSAVWDAIKWLGEKAWEGIRAIGIAAFEKLALLGSLAWDFVSFMPARLWRVVIDGWEGISGVLSWLWKGITGGVSWAWAWDGFKRGLAWCGQTLLQLFELVGGGDALQFVWGLIFHTRQLTDDERNASLSVHGPGLIPYDEVRVDQDSFMVKLGMWINRIFDPTAGPRAVTTMHIIQAPKTLDLETTVHELTHVAQYQKIGAVYMPQALHAQGTAMGYDYGNLAQARTDGKHFTDFNREQQAQICEDYYLAKNGRPTYYHGTQADLEPFIQDMRTGAF